MNEEEKRLLEETARLTKENHKILKGMQRKQALGALWSTIKWIVIILFTIWSWMLVQPYIERMQRLYEQVQETSNTVNDLKVKAETTLNPSGLQDVLNVFRMGSQ